MSPEICAIVFAPFTLCLSLLYFPFKKKILEVIRQEKESLLKSQLDEANSNLEKLSTQIGNLQKENSDLTVSLKTSEEREKEWTKLAGYTLEQAIEKKNAIEKTRGDTTNAKDVGDSLEEHVIATLNRLFPKDFSFNVKWKHQKSIDSGTGAKKRADFILEFTNNNLNGTFKVLIECKNRIGGEENELMIVPDVKKEEEDLERGKIQIKKGANQLIDYSREENVNFCLLLTTAKFESERGFAPFDFEKYGIKYKSSFPAIFLVSPDTLIDSLAIILALNKAYEPTISICSSFEESWNEGLSENLLKAKEITDDAIIKMGSIQKRSKEAAKFTRLLYGDIEKLLEYLEKREDYLHNSLQFKALSSKKETLKLDQKENLDAEEPKEED